MQEREQQVVAQDEGVAVVASAPLEMLQRARNSEGDERLQLAGRLNALLKKSAAEHEREVWGQFLIEKLDDEAFHELYDSEGVSCRAVAVEAVLALGFPHALHLEPADLEYLRTVKPNRGAPGGWRAMAVVTGVLAALFALAFFIHL
ncbi:MAG: hypothetical protein JNK82_40220 [Myxococcaceae bacterium]|nr:hypothetical protein [Myxococcaceae bacterium]